MEDDYLFDWKIFGRKIMFLFGILAGVILMAILSLTGILDGEEELGQAICEEEYGMDFDYFLGGKLYCKNVIENYDGLEVVIDGGG